ncbi:proline--tRNA ligase [Candidatus Altiarchaeota archaeon]
MKDDFGEWYRRMLEENEIIDQRYPVKGMLVYRRWGMQIIREMQHFLENALEENGHEPVYFPVLIPDNILGKEGEHIAGFEEQVYWVTHAGKTPLERKLALRPTSETCMYEMFSLWVRSHADLPIKIHQSVPVYRYETKHTRPLLRGREFLWNEGHTAFATQEEAEQNIQEIKMIYGRLISELLCLPYEVNQRPYWDKFPGSDYSLAFESLMPDGRSLQLATAHNLGQNFSKVFSIQYEDESGSKNMAWQTSYGPGFGRLLAATMSIHGDEKGLVLPPKVAPTQIVIIPIFVKNASKEEIQKVCEQDAKALKESGFRVELDFGDQHPGDKYYKWEKKGVPIRLEVGPREVKEEKRTVVRRDTGEKSAIETKNLEKEIQKFFTEIEENLRKTAQKKFDERHYVAKDLKELRKFVGKGFVSCGWCQTDECAKSIDETGTILSMSDETGTCVVCGAKGAKTIKVAKTY